MHEALRVLRTRGIMTLSVPKKETSTEKLLRKLSVNGLEPRELVDDDKTLDYVVIGKEDQSIDYSRALNISTIVGKV